MAALDAVGVPWLAWDCFWNCALLDAFSLHQRAGKCVTQFRDGSDYSYGFRISVGFWVPVAEPLAALLAVLAAICFAVSNPSFFIA